MFSNFMVDLETLDTSPNAAIISIGVVAFDIDIDITCEFYREITLSSALVHGSLCASTLKWWMAQEERARAVFNSPTAIDLHTALIELNTWISGTCPDIASREIWGNGVAFDNVILRNAYFKENIEPPWIYRNDKCYRTLINMFKDQVPLEKAPFIHAHNALDDARFQTNHLLKVLRYVRSIT